MKLLSLRLSILILFLAISSCNKIDCKDTKIRKTKGYDTNVISEQKERLNTYTEIDENKSLLQTSALLLIHNGTFNDFISLPNINWVEKDPSVYKNNQSFVTLDGVGYLVGLPKFLNRNIEIPYQGTKVGGDTGLSYFTIIGKNNSLNSRETAVESVFIQNLYSCENINDCERYIYNQFNKEVVIQPLTEPCRFSQDDNFEFNRYYSIEINNSSVYLHGYTNSTPLKNREDGLFSITLFAKYPNSELDISKNTCKPI